MLAFRMLDENRTIDLARENDRFGAACGLAASGVEGKGADVSLPRTCSTAIFIGPRSQQIETEPLQTIDFLANFHHYPFKISEAMLARLTPNRRTIIELQPPSFVPPGAVA